MPEIYEMFFGLSQLLRLIPHEDNEVKQKIEEYESQLEKDMAANRLKLFSEYGYNSEFEHAYFN